MRTRVGGYWRWRWSMREQPHRRLSKVIRAHVIMRRRRVRQRWFPKADVGGHGRGGVETMVESLLSVTVSLGRLVNRLVGATGPNPRWTW